MSQSKDQRYPLAAAVKVRLAAKDEAVRILGDRQRDLAEEEEKLRRLEVRRTVLLQEKALAGEQLFDTEDGLIDVGEIDRRRGAIEFLSQRLEACNLEVETQEEAAQAALATVEQARQELVIASREVEVLEKHRAEWDKKRRKEERHREEMTLQEIRAHQFSSRQKAGRAAPVENSKGES